MSISRRYHKPLTEIAAANKIPPHTLVKIGDRIAIPGKLVAAKQAPTVVASPKLQAPSRAPGTVVAQNLASAEPSSTARLATSGPQATADAGAPASTGAPAFRWPVRGRVITGFGPKPNGQQSDGIDLAVPEGTAVRASEDGVVAYAGNELKGYGNLILVRHANGFVTAYAHASEILVKRNDEVRRGQIIAKSGQSGSVTAPQLHFEIRKGSAPVDPAQYLPSGA
jgi:murein DD-endopeptidase MepM/ murein hydrolase activator NlpD